MQPANEHNADLPEGRDAGEGKLFPYNTVVGVVDEPEQLESLVNALAAEGFSEGEFHVLCGEASILRIDAEGKRKGLLSRVFRIVDHLGPEHDHTAQHVRALENGQFVVIVDAQDKATKLRARDALAANSAHFVNYYSRWTVEKLAP